MKMIVGAGVIAVLIVCGAYFGGLWLYGDDPVPLGVSDQPSRVSVETSAVDNIEVNEPMTSGVFADESDSYVVESPDVLGHPHGESTHSHDTQAVDESLSEAWDWDEEIREERHEEFPGNRSDEELRAKFLASVESGKFSRKLREYFEAQHGKGPEVDMLVRYYDKLFTGQAMLSDSIKYNKAQLALGIGPYDAEHIDRMATHLEKHGDEPVSHTLTITSLDRLEVE